MHNAPITVSDALKLKKKLFIDTRSPLEFERGHIPGAQNIPLLSNDERAVVGTSYAQEGSSQAKHKGLEIVSGKLPDIVLEIEQLSKKDIPIIIHCWRGGMRSKSVVSILDIMGIPAMQLLGGYKAYRNYVLSEIGDFSYPPIVMLCGSTGVGKTEVLKLLAMRDEPVIDLEGIANHRGSMFGHVGLGTGTSAQNFDAQLLNELYRFKESPYIILECESKKIGNIYLPDTLFTAMRGAHRILLSAPIEIRVKRLCGEYCSKEALLDPLIEDRIKALLPKLGRQKVNKMLIDFQAGKLEELITDLLMDYYDPLYGYEEKPDGATSFVLQVNATELSEATQSVFQYLEHLKGGRML